MIKYLKHDEIDIALWNKCIVKSMSSYIYAYAWYLNIVAGEWDALIEDDYVSVFPLPYRIKHGIKYIYQPPFTQQLGLFSTKLQGVTKLYDFISAIPKEFKVVEINLNKYYQLMERKTYKLNDNINIELDLASNYDKIKSKYSKNLKRNIKKAQKNNLTISEQIKPEQIIQLFKDNKAKEIDDFSEEDYIRLGRLMYFLINKDAAKIYGVYSQENNLIAATFFLYDKNRYIFLFSGLNEEGKLKGAMPYIINNFIKEHSNTNKVFDFEGSNNPTIARFFKSFGGKEFHYPGLRYYRFSFPLNYLFRFYKRLR